MQIPDPEFFMNPKEYGLRMCPFCNIWGLHIPLNLLNFSAAGPELGRAVLVCSNCHFVIEDRE